LPFDSHALSELKYARNPRFVPTPSELAILDQLSDNGHVIMPKMHSNEGNAELVFAMMGETRRLRSRGSVATMTPASSSR